MRIVEEGYIISKKELDEMIEFEKNGLKYYLIKKIRKPEQEPINQNNLIEMVKNQPYITRDQILKELNLTAHYLNKYMKKFCGTISFKVFKEEVLKSK